MEFPNFGQHPWTNPKAYNFDVSMNENLILDELFVSEVLLPISVPRMYSDPNFLVHVVTTWRP